MSYIKKHKFTALMILIYIVVIAFGFFIYNMFIGSSGLPQYGDRLDGIEAVPITEQNLTDIVNAIKEQQFVLECKKPNLSGKTLEVYAVVGDNAEVSQAKSLANIVKEKLSQEQNDFYDIQVFVVKNNNCNIIAKGKVDAEGNFTSEVEISFNDDLSKNSNVLDYGLLLNETVTYNKEQKLTIKDDGTFIVYGYTKDKVGETKCSIKIVKNSQAEGEQETEISSLTQSKFPIIGYKKAKTNDFSWTKER